MTRRSSSRRRRSSAAIENQQERESDAAAVAAKSFSGRSSEVVLAVATQRAPLMGRICAWQSVRDVWRTCAQLGLKLEAKVAGRALRHFPRPAPK